MNQPSRLTPLGRLLSLLLVGGLIVLGVYLVSDRFSDRGSSPPGSPSGGDADESAPAVSAYQAAVPQLAPAAPFAFKDNIVPIEISEYAGYAGLIAANGGLEPSESSVFFRNGGFKVKLTISEDESWSDLNTGKIAGSVTTVDVLAAYGRQFHAVVPVQIGYSRGADGLVVRNEIKRINDLKGKVIATAQFTEIDFFIRYLAQEAGLLVNPLGSLDATPSPDRLNLVYTDEGFAAGDLFINDVKSGRNRLAGCVTWEPKVSEVVAQSGGVARILTTNKNLLVIGDILVLHRGFAEENPKIVQGLVQGVLEGNRMVRNNAEAHLDTVARAFKWTREEARTELAKVHLSNLPENLAFFSGAIDAAGSFGGIYQSAVLAYGSDLIRDPPDSSRFASLAALKALEASGLFKDQKVAIAPIKSTGSRTVEGTPLLSKDIRFLFEPNSAELDTATPSNVTNLDAIKQLLQVSPGSTILLRGHVDNALVEEFRRTRQEAYAALAGEAEQILRRMARRSRKPAGPSRRALQQLRERLAAVERIDFFGSAGRDRVIALVRDIEARAGGKQPGAGAAGPAGPAGPYRGRTWVTRPRPGVDRMASAWLIRRFIDGEARFDFAADRHAAPADAVPFDMFGVEFTHRGDLCTFEMLCDTFRLSDPALAAVAAIVHDLDLKDNRFGAPQASTVELIIEGLRLAHAEDGALLAAGMTLFDALYRALEQTTRTRGPRPVAKRARGRPQARSRSRT